MSLLAFMATIALGSVAVVLIFELWPKDWIDALMKDIWGK